MKIHVGKPIEVTEVKSTANGWSVEGYVSTFGDPPDLGGDVVLQGAFASSVKAWRSGRKKIRFLYSHDPIEVLGAPTDLHEDRHGLYGQFKISKTRRGEEVRELLKDGGLDSFSIGYIPVVQDFRGEIRLLEEIDLLEASIVAIPMNTLATVSTVKHGRGPVEPTTYMRLRHKLVRAGRIRPETRSEYTAYLLGRAERQVRRSSGLYV